MSASATKKRLVAQRAQLQRAREDAALAVERAHRAARSLVFGDGKTPFEAAFDPPEEAEEKDDGWKPWPKVEK